MTGRSRVVEAQKSLVLGHSWALRQHPSVRGWLLRQTTARPVTRPLSCSVQGVREGHWRCLRDVMAHTRGSRPALERCSCAEPKPCAHVRTYRNGNRTESRPAQLDYVFATQPVLAELSSCVVVDDEAAWALSDHCPVVVDLNTSAGLAPIQGDEDSADEAVIDDSELDEMKRWHMARMTRLLNGELK